MQKITELTVPPIPGKTYLVPCIAMNLNNPAKGIIPIIGNFHTDDEIGFLGEHVHPDFRFFTESQFLKTIDLVTKAGKYLHSIVYNAHGSREISWRPKTCYRTAFPDYPDRTLDVDTMALLEHIYADAKLENGICPHKGINLNSISPDAEGNKTCPGHCLKWDKDGKVN